jgi:hypothetical protein
MSEEHTNHGERITAVESEVRALTANVAQLTNLVREGHEATRIEIQKLGQQIGMMSRANWPVYFGAISIVMAVGAAAMGPTWLRINTMETDLKELHHAQISHSQLPIHPMAAEQIRLIDWRLDHIEQTLKGK